VVVTFSLHLAMLAPFLGHPDALRRPKAEEGGSGETGGAVQSTTAPTLILINLTAAIEHPSDELLMASMNLATRDELVSVLASDELPAVQIDLEAEVAPEAATETVAENPVARAAMFGRYTGQISQRVERAWRRPRTGLRDPREIRPVGVQPESGDPSRFHCEARVAQNATGKVEQIELLSCNGTVAWQMSLVSAIYQASPLPAPPVPSVFSNILTLSFQAEEWREDGNQDGYETAAELESRLQQLSRR